MLQHNHFLPKIKGPILLTLLIFFPSFFQALYLFYALIFALSFEVVLFMLVFWCRIIIIIIESNEVSIDLDRTCFFVLHKMK